MPLGLRCTGCFLNLSPTQLLTIQCEKIYEYENIQSHNNFLFWPTVEFVVLGASLWLMLAGVADIARTAAAVGKQKIGFEVRSLGVMHHPLKFCRKSILYHVDISP